MQPRPGAYRRPEPAPPADHLWISGRHPVLEALRAGLPARQLLLRGPVKTGILADLRREARARGVPGEEVDNATLDRVMRHTEHRGAALQLEPLAERPLERDLAALAEGKTPVLLVLDGLQDPQNLGAVARSAEAAGVTALVISRWAQAPLSDAAFRASAGALAWLPVLVAEDLAEALHWLGRKGYLRLGLTEKARELPRRPRETGPLALVLGGEGRGLSQRVLECLDVELRIPMRGHVTSLNASVAAAVVLYQLLGEEDEHAV